ncbi:GNAT family N-acetyltransferase [Methanobrevibacter sp. OttesenSCG-928-K11]|nr:GNAT family N-acetyltransferase [Methanobrevibacter sp. OttesenSCG-928-K11]
MIKEFKKEYLDEIMNIWLQTNIETHDFISKDYWNANFKNVEEIIPHSLIYIFEENNIIKGFIGLNNDNIEGLFVLKRYQKEGIGTKLLNKSKIAQNSLSLKVYVKNKIAISFYEKNGFEIIKKELDENTNEYEYIMKWI